MSEIPLDEVQKKMMLKIGKCTDFNKDTFGTYAAHFQRDYLTSYYVYTALLLELEKMQGDGQDNSLLVKDIADLKTDVDFLNKDSVALLSKINWTSKVCQTVPALLVRIETLEKLVKELTNPLSPTPAPTPAPVIPDAPSSNPKTLSVKRPADVSSK
jgi:hypothetical protein